MYGMHRIFQTFAFFIFLLALCAPTAQAADGVDREESKGGFCFGVFEIPIPQCEALVALYNATNGPNWTQNTGWLSTFTPCSWHGVSCNGADVTELALPNNGLVGTVPPEIQGLTALINLSFAGNSLGGALPSTFGELDNLSALILSGNAFSSLGSGFTDLASLALVNAQENHLTTLPADFEALSTLQIAQFDRNRLSTLPSDLDGLTSLSALSIAGNLFESLPDEFCDIPSLALVDLSYNKIQATPGTPCLATLDPDYELSQTVPPVITDAFADPERRFDDAIVEWTPIVYTGDGGGYKLCWSQTANGDFVDCRTIPDKSISSFTAKGLRSGERYFFKIETFTDAHPQNPNNLESGQTDAWPLGNSGLPTVRSQQGPCEAHINQIGNGNGHAYALETVYFYGVAGPLGRVIDSQTWSYTPVDDQGNPTDPKVTLSTSATLATNALPEGRLLIEFEATENPPVGTCSTDSQFFTILPDRSSTDLEIRRTEIQLVEAGNPFNELDEVPPSTTIDIQFMVHNLSAISEQTEVLVEAWDGAPDDGGIQIGTEIITAIPPQGSVPVSIPWNVGTQEGYRVFTLRVDYQANVDDDHSDHLPTSHPDYPPYPEVNTGNNLATGFVLVGQAVLGNFDIDVNCEFDLSANILNQHWAGVPYPLIGDARYAFGNRLPVMGAEVEILITDLSHNLVLQQMGRTIAPYGSFYELVTIQDPGTYNVTVRVDDSTLIGEHSFQITVIDPPPWPNLHFDQHPYDCHRNAITFEGPLVWREACNYYTVQAAKVDIRALLQNTGFEDATDYQVEVWQGAPGSGTLLTTHDSTDTTWPGTLLEKDSHNLTIPWPMGATNSEGMVPNDITSYNICLDAELLAPLPELTGVDNRVCRQLHVLKRAPDLHPTNIRFGPWPVLDEDTLEVTVDIINLTPISLNPDHCKDSNCKFKVTYYSGQPGADGTIMMGSQHFTPNGSQLQNRGDRVTLPTFSWSPLSIDGANFGWQPIWVVVDTFDPDSNDNIIGQVDEAREYNNRNWRWVCVFKPNDSFIRAHALASSSYGLQIGQSLTLTPYVRNKGELDHPVNVRVDLYQGHPDSGGTLLGDCTVPATIPGRGAVKACSPGFSWTAPATPGTIYIYARIHNTTETWARGLTIYADPPPDLQIFSEDIILPATPPRLREVINLQAEIRNVSELRDATNFTVRFRADTPVGLFDLGSVPVPLLAQTPPLGTPTSMVVNGPAVTITEPYYAFLVELIANPLEGDGNFDDNAATRALEADSGPQAGFYYPLESRDLTPVRNAASNDHDGVAQGGVRNLCGVPAWADPADSNLNTCFFGQFDGMDDSIQVANTPDLDFIDQLSVMAWAVSMPTTVFPQDGDITGRGDRNAGVLQDGFALGIENRRWEFTVVTMNGTCTVSSGLIPSPAEWDFVAATYDGANIQLYVGDENGMGTPFSTPCTGNIDWGSPGDDFEISPSQKPFRGLIDEVRLFGQALDASALDGFRTETRVCDCDLIDPVARNLRTGDDYQVDLSASNEPFHPLQRAVDEAMPGDTIAVRCGNREVHETTKLASGVRLRGGFDGNWMHTGCPTTIDGLSRTGPCFEAIGVDASAALEELTLTACTSSGCGGGFYGENTAMTLRRLTWDSNEADTGGGACFVNTNNAKILDSTLQDNRAATAGGGLHLSGGSLRLRDVNFEDNESTLDGGALSTDMAPFLSATDTSFLDNTAIDRGGAVFLGDDTVADFLNVLWARNEADRGAALGSAMFCGLLDLNNATTHANVNVNGAVIDLGGSCATSPTATLAYMNNSILWNHSTDELSNSHWQVHYSNVDGGSPGVGNLQQMPVFFTEPSGTLSLFSQESVDQGSTQANALGLGEDQGYRTEVPFPPTADTMKVDLGFHHQDAMALKPNRLAYYSLDGYTWRPTDEVRDLSGRNHHGRKLGTATHDSTNPAVGKSDSGTCNYATFDGVSAQIRVPQCRTLEVSNDFTVAAWVRLANTGSAMSILRHGDGFYGWELAYDGASWEATSFNGTTAEIVSGTQAAVAGQWYHLAMVMDAGTLKLYVDAALDNSIAATGIAWDPLAPSDLRFADGSFFEGEIDEVEIHDEALDLQAIQDLEAARHDCSTLLFFNGFNDGTTDGWSQTVQ